LGTDGLAMMKKLQVWEGGEWVWSMCKLDLRTGHHDWPNVTRLSASDAACTGATSSRESSDEKVAVAHLAAKTMPRILAQTRG
tara:strand:- start:162457 stop:162705 length:249 start_codon:yes stop_codon:yes gene_type:complete